MKYRTGDIVHFENYTFRDGEIDKKDNRPCVVVYSFIDNEGEKIVVAPLTTNDKAYYISDGVLLSTKLRNRYECFAEIRGLTLHFADSAINDDIRVNNNDKKKILLGIKALGIMTEDYQKICKYIDYYYFSLDIRKKVLEEEKVLKEKEEKLAKQQRKKERTEKRRLSKRFDK